MRLQHATIDPPVWGEVRVKIHAIGLNFADVFSGLGLYGPISSGEIHGSFIPGLEFSGVVEAIGDETSALTNPGTVSGEEQQKRGGQMVNLSEKVWGIARTAAKDLKVGDRVMGATRFGGYSTRINIAAHQLVHIPETWSFEQASAATVQSLTVYYALTQLGAVQEGKTVLIHSAAGGCGMQALEICRKLKCNVIGTVGSEKKVGELVARFPWLQRGQVIVRDSKRFKEQIESAVAFLNTISDGDEPITGPDVVLDAVLGDFYHPGFAALNSGGRYVVYGAASMTPTSNKLGFFQWLKLAWKYLWRPKADVLELPGENKSVMGFNLIHCLNDAKRLLGLMNEIQALDLRPPHVGETFEFKEMLAALGRFQSGNTVGKVVVKVNET